MNKWDTFGVSYELFDIVGCVISDGIKRKDIYMGLNARKYLDQPYEHSAFWSFMMNHKKVRVQIFKSK